MISAYCPVKGSRVNLVQMQARGGTILKELVDFIYGMSPQSGPRGTVVPDQGARRRRAPRGGQRLGKLREVLLNACYVNEINTTIFCSMVQQINANAGAVLIPGPPLHCRFLGVQKVPIQSNHIGKYSMKSALIWCFELISWPRVSKDMTTLGQPIDISLISLTSSSANQLQPS